MAIIVSVLVYGLFTVVLGVYADRKTTKTLEDYYTGNRMMGPIVLGLMIAATQSSAYMIYGLPAYAHTASGAAYSLGLIAYAFSMVGIWALVGYRIWIMGKKYNWITVADYLGDRYYSNTFRVIAAFITVFFMLPYIGIQIIGLGKGLQVATGGQVSWFTAAIGASIFMLIYVMLGGIRGVAWTDVIQGTAFGSLVVIVFVWLAVKLGGMNEITKLAMESHNGQGFGPPGINGAFKWDGGFMHLWIMSLTIITWPHQFSRIFLAKTKKVFIQGALIGAFFIMLQNLSIMMGTHFGHAVYGSKLPFDPDMLTQVLVNSYLPTFMSAFVIIAVFSAAMSTADGQLLAVSGSLTRDVYQRIINPNAKEEKLVNFSKITILVVLALSFAAGCLIPGIIASVVLRFSFPGFAQMMPAIVGGALWRRGTKEAAIVSTVIGVFIYIGAIVFQISLPLGALFWSLAINSILYVFVSFVTPAPPQYVIENYYDYVDSVIAKDASEKVYKKTNTVINQL